MSEGNNNERYLDIVRGRFPGGKNLSLRILEVFDFEGRVERVELNENKTRIVGPSEARAKFIHYSASYDDVMIEVIQEGEKSKGIVYTLNLE